MFQQTSFARASRDLLEREPREPDFEGCPRSGHRIWRPQGAPGVRPDASALVTALESHIKTLQGDTGSSWNLFQILR
jgi:hypothetical protein